MADEKQNKKEISPEELAVRNLGLESYLGVAGQNYIRQNRGLYGELVSNAAENIDILESKEAQEIRKQIEEQEKAVREQTGYVGPYDGARNSDILFGIYRITRESLALVKLGDLEKILKEKGAKLDFDVPEKLKNLSQNDLVEKAQEKGVGSDGKIDISTLDETYQDAFVMQKVLGQAYDLLGAQKIMQGVDFYAGVNAQGKAIAKKYAPKKEK